MLESIIADNDQLVSVPSDYYTHRQIFRMLIGSVSNDVFVAFISLDA